MKLEELYSILKNESGSGTLVLDADTAERLFFRLTLALGSPELELTETVVTLLPQSVKIEGICFLNGWNRQESFHACILCSGDEDALSETLEVEASFWCSFEGTLGEFFGEVYPCVRTDGSGHRLMSGIISDFPVSAPQISFFSGDYDLPLPFSFRAVAHMEHLDGWEPYGFLFGGKSIIAGRVSRENEFQLSVPLPGILSGMFPSLSLSLLLFNKIEYGESVLYPYISEAGLEIRLRLEHIPEAVFTVPLFGQAGRWNLHMFIPDGAGVGDLLSFLTYITKMETRYASLCLPEGFALDRFRLYRMDILSEREGLRLSPVYMTMEFSLSEPWTLPVPYVTLERLYAGIQVSMKGQTGKNAPSESLFTGEAGGTLSFAVGKYTLGLSLDMSFPELDFSASAELSEGESEASPVLSELAQTFSAPLPDGWGSEKNVLAEVAVSGSVSRREIYVHAAVRDVLSFSVGTLVICLEEITADAEVSPSDFLFSVRGTMAFGTGEDRFILYASAAYQNPGWFLEGGLASGEVRIGRLLAEIFGIGTTPGDVADLALTELYLSYGTENGEFSLTAQFEMGWHITLLGQKLVLGGRVQVLALSGKETDVAALAYMSLGVFQVLAQVEHIQTEKDRSYLFRLSFREAYVQASWFLRGEDEILSVSLGGMTLGSLVESLVGMMNPNHRYQLPEPWSILNQIRLDWFFLEFNTTKKQTLFLYRADLDIAGLMYLDTVGLRYDMEKNRLFFLLTGRLLGVEYGEEDPVIWDAMDGRPPVGAAEDEKTFQLSYLGIGQHVHVEGILKAKSIGDAIQALKDQLSPEAEGAFPGSISFDQELSWLFGLDVTVNNSVNVQLVLNDPVLYGVLVTVQAKEGSALASFNGFGIELLYRRISDSVGMFKGEVLVPVRYRTFRLGILTLTLGTISLEIYTNGGFYLDLGFPHQQDFSRSFQFQWSIYTGRGGIYLGILKDVPKLHVPEIVNGNFSPVMMLGIGMSVGMGRTFDLGIVAGGVTFEVFGILEGAIAIFHEQDTGVEDTYYYVRAAVGISGRLFLSADLKIIAVQASAAVDACAVIMIQSYRKTQFELELSLTLSASFKILFIKISFSFSFHQKLQFSIGEDSLAPWIEKEEKNEVRIQRQRRSLRICPVKLEETALYMEIVPVFVLEHPSGQSGDRKEYGLVLLLVMDRENLFAWNSLLVSWMLSIFDESCLSREDAEQLSGGLPDSLTWQMLEQFLSENVRIDYRIRWETAENEETEGYVFPMLPPLTATVYGKEFARSVSYHEYQPVDEEYFDFVTAYFEKLNADPSYQPKKREATADGGEKLPAAEAFLTDYVQMYLRELAGKTGQLFRRYTGRVDVRSAREDFGVPGEDFVLQNQNLMISPGSRLAFDTLLYTVTAGDTLGTIGERYGAETDALWEDVKEVLSLPQAGSRIAVGSGTFDNRETKLTLKEVAAVLFVRFFEPDVPEDAFYTGDIIRANPSLSMEWQETEPFRTRLELPERARPWVSLRGDTPLRLGSFLYVLGTTLGEIPEWDGFLALVCALNQMVEEDIPGTIRFEVPDISVYRERTLLELTDRIYPDRRREETKSGCLADIPVLRPGVQIAFSCAGFTVPEDRSFTLAEIMRESRCTAQGLSLALEKAGTFPEGQKTVIENAAFIPKERIEEALGEQAEETGAMLSRFLLQGLKVPDPQSGVLSPLYEMLGQQIPIGDTPQELELSITLPEEGCSWIQPEEQHTVLDAARIQALLPDGDFAGFPERWIKSPDFRDVCQYFSLTSHSGYYRKDTCLSLYHISAEITDILASGSLEPLMINQRGDNISVCWGCLLSLEISECAGEGMASVYGADAVKRRQLHQLLNLKKTEVHFLYRTSALSGEGGCYMEYAWSEEESFLIKTNFSVESRMSPLLRNVGTGEETEHVVKPGQGEKILRMLWECSTVGGGGYYFRLISEDGKTLPEDIFDSEGRGTLYVLVLFSDNLTEFSCVNCCVSDVPATSGEPLILRTRDERQMMRQPCFPAGCVGLQAGKQIPADEDSSSGAAMHRLFQITGYQLRGNGTYRESGLSAPVIPAKAGDEWVYEPVIPVYRYAGEEEGAEASPYRAVGKPAAISMELRDIFGNSVSREETLVTPGYNDVLIGWGEWWKTRFYFRILPGTGGAELSVSLEFSEGDEEEIPQEAVSRQRLAAWQISCRDVEITVTSPLNQEEWELSACGESGFSFLDKVRIYAEHLAEYMEGGRQEPPESLTLIFQLHLDEYPLPEQIFEISGTVVIKRDVNLAPEPVAQQTVSCILPYSAMSDTYPYETFCEEAERACPGLLFAREENGSSLYGVTTGSRGFLKKCLISPYCFSAGSEEPGRIVEAPEFYALRPLCNGFLTREAAVRNVLENGRLSEDMTQVLLSDVDMEVWGMQFLQDMEVLFTPEKLERAGFFVPVLLDGLLSVKLQLADAVSKQITPLRKGVSHVPEEIRERIRDHLRRSLSSGYDMDVAACYQIEAVAEEHCRLAAGISSQMESCIIQPGKADTEKGEFCVFFKNQFREQTRELHAEIAFTELEYDITTEEGYDNSRWLRFVRPFTPRADMGRITLDSQLHLPNPLKNCPASPVFDMHNCNFGSGAGGNGEEMMFLHSSGAEKGVRLRWDYILQFHCCFEPQDTLFLCIEFEPVTNKKSRGKRRDLFDTLAEYMQNRQKLAELLESSEEGKYKAAFESVLDVSRGIAESWENWTEGELCGFLPRESGSSASSCYSCTMSCEAAETGIRFFTEPTKEGVDFLERTGASVPEIQTLTGGEETELLPRGKAYSLRFAFRGLPLYQCARAVPYLYIVRNENLLYDRVNRRYLDVAEPFIYRTPEVSAPACRADGSIMEEVLLGDTEETAFGEEAISRAVDMLFEVFHLAAERLLLELEVSYYFGLNDGKREPRILLPVTFVPLSETIGSDGLPTECRNALKRNIIGWFLEQLPETNCSGLLFRLKLYEPGTGDRIMYFARLNVRFGEDECK